MTLGWAVLGTGLHVQNYMAPALSRAADTAPVAVCSRDGARAQEMAERFGFARAYDSYEALLQDKQVDVVYICTPNSLHSQQTIQAAQAGKHVLVEKPMALNVEEAQAMVQACQDRGVQLGVGFHLRHHPAHQSAREMIREGKLGRVFHFTADWVGAGAMREGWWQDPAMVGAYIMMGRGVHVVDLVCYLLDKEPEAVTMVSDGQRPDRALEGAAVCTFRFADDTFATFIVARYTPGAATTFAVYGTEGYVRGVGTVGSSGGGTLSLATPRSTAETAYQAKDPYQAQIEAFNQAVSAGQAPSASGLDGLRVVRITEALLQSARSGETVRLTT